MIIQVSKINFIEVLKRERRPIVTSMNKFKFNYNQVELYCILRFNIPISIYLQCLLYRNQVKRKKKYKLKKFQHNVTTNSVIVANPGKD